jgi:hypothetical protein
MKMAQKELLPYLHHLFAACLRLGHHPAAFKQASTVMLRKPDKDDYEQPKSWRPVALLPCMGKLLEKIFTHRLKLLALDHNLLPNMQFGTPGKCTTKALQFLLNNVYAAWVRKDRRLATLMGLDITGAYDRVDRVKLMKILEQAGIPDWMLRFIWSFLTDRNTDMRLPGFTSSKFWVNIGIPQGSPLSPILFLFFSMPILGTASEYTNSRVTIYASLTLTIPTYSPCPTATRPTAKRSRNATTGSWYGLTRLAFLSRLTNTTSCTSFLLTTELIPSSTCPGFLGSRARSLRAQ